MSLQVWMTFNNEKLQNYGLNNCKPSGTAFSVNNNGVVGKCIKTTGAGSLSTSYDGNIINTNSISFGGWFKFNKSEIGTILNALSFNSSRTTPTGNLIGNSSYGGIGIQWDSNNMYSDGTFTTLYAFGAIRTPVSSKITSKKPITFDTWTHIFTVYDRNLNIQRLYIDGTLFTQNSVFEFTDAPSRIMNINYSAVWGGNGPSAYIPFYVDDIRIYDHALTEEDVKRIYQQKMFELVPYSGAEDVLFDRSGFMNMPLINSNAVFQNNALYFNGTNAMLRPKNGNVGFTMDDGTLSVWFSISTAPTGYQMLYIDSVSKFAIGFLNSGSFIVTCNNSAMPTFSASHVKYDGSINNIIVSYNTSKTPQFCLINGIQEANVATNNWTETSGLTIGSRMYNTANSNFKGKIFKVGVYNRQFTQDEAMKLYNSERGMFLPDDYIQLEYIQGDKSAYIDTGFILNSDCSAEAKFCFINAEGGSTGNFIMGCRKSYGNLAFNLVGYSGGVKWASNYGSSIGDFGNSDTNIHVLKRIKEKVYLDGDLKITTAQSSFTTTGNAYIFSCNQNGTPYLTSNIKLWYLKIWENDLLVRNFIPAKRKSDNVIGMYDMVSKQFFTNSGTGSFTGA